MVIKSIDITVMSIFIALHCNGCVCIKACMLAERVCVCVKKGLKNEADSPLFSIYHSAICCSN